MFGSQTKSVMVVYPKGYSDVATFLKHTISKHNSLDSTLWTVEQYRQNLPTLSGKSYVIFLGTDDDCPISKPFHDNVKIVTFSEGACYAVDGSKALVYGLDDNSIEMLAEHGASQKYVDFDGLPVNFGPDVEPMAAISSLFGEVNLGNITKTGWGSISLATTVVGGLVSDVAERTTKKAKGMWSASDQRIEQTKTASNLFLERGLSNWLGLDDESAE